VQQGQSVKSEKNLIGLEAELRRITNSETFAESARLRELLSYVVEATLAGRADTLLGKNIGLDVFGVDPQQIHEVSTVRVEMGRLRRRMKLYYADEGANNPVRIDIPKGSYIPSCVQLETPASIPRFPKRWLWTGVAITVAMFLVAGIWGGQNSPTDKSRTERSAPKFTESAEAYSMFFESQRIANPPVIAARVEAAISLALEIQKIDPSFGGGYAAEALQLWNFVIFGHSDQPQADIKRAVALAQKAIRTDPGFSWGHHALGEAQHLNGDMTASIAAFDRAIDLDPNEIEHLARKGLTLAVFGKGPEGAALLENAIERRGPSLRHPDHNLLGIAYFHSRRFKDAAETIERNRENGGPSGPHMLVYLASAHALAGHVGRADAAAKLLRKELPGFSAEAFINRHLHIQSQRDIVTEGLLKSGLTIDEIPGS